MWNDIIIGEGEKLCSSIHYKNIGDISISQNRSSYWITGAFLKTGMTIYKTTDVGIEIAKRIDVKGDEEYLINYIDNLVIKHLPLYVIKSKIDALLESAIDEGMYKKQIEILKVLGI